MDPTTFKNEPRTDDRDLSKAAESVLTALDRKVRFRHKTDGHVGTAGVITEGSVGFARRTLGFTNVGAGDYIVQIDSDSPFYISKAKFEELYDVTS